MRRIAPPENEYNPYQIQIDALQDVIKHLPGKVPADELLKAYASVSIINNALRASLPADDTIFFYRFISDISRQQMGEDHEAITTGRLDEALERIKNLSRNNRRRIYY